MVPRSWQPGGPIRLASDIDGDPGSDLGVGPTISAWAGVAGHDVGLVVGAVNLDAGPRRTVSFGLPLTEQPHDLITASAVPRTSFHGSQIGLRIKDCFERVEVALSLSS